ncbi:FxSxx-COOH system tetratricopeptide repeat protein [Saccharothrix syringae]|uniref:Tetratricopeptide repeat protein n=1 Tax=Saccharothrix syringae TaxID=103733 RepID=A0A5Q0H8I7_SACSY|nr:FxSxx-COOH system tetratricopeptide repeat protein [Saccharothrix syringae]QFZ21972.1 tetratricopeptide repeat protein [Saccharothrix syringae]
MTGPPPPGSGRLTVRELRDALWLARLVVAGGSAGRPDVGGRPAPGAHPVAPPDEAHPAGPVEPRPPEERVPAPPTGVRPTTDATAAATTPLPAVPVLPERARIARALRPLDRTAPSPWRRELDEEATARHAAQDGLWMPAWRPEPAHPFDLVLVVDTSPSMAIWQHTAREFAELLRRQGAFRDVRHHRVDFSPADPAELRVRPEGPTATPVPWSRLADPTGRRVVLVFTDGVGGAWRSGAAGHVLHRWGRVMPVAVVQALDRRLWSWSALGTSRFQLSAPFPGAPNRLLRATPLDPDLTASREPGTVVPVLALSPDWMAAWARLVSQPGAAPVEVTATAVRPFRREPAPEPAPGPEPTPRERVLRFRTVASVTAFRLAGLLAAAPLDLASMKLVQRVAVPGSGLTALAEVLLGDLLVRLPKGGGPVEYDFRPGVREELLAGLHRADTVRVVRLLGDHAGPSDTALHDYARAVDAPDEVGLPEPSAANAPHLRVQEAVFRALSGPYLARANRLAVLLGRGRVAHAPPRRRAVPEHRPDVLGPMPLRNPDFVGREDLLEAVRALLTGTPGPVVLHGAGGMGKSQAALEYLYRHAPEYQVVWWVPAEHQAQVRAALVELAGRLDLPTGSSVSGLLRALGEGRPHARWLLVFDNAGAPGELLPFLPSGGHVIVTSGDPAWSGHARPVRVDRFSRAESVALLRGHDPDLSRADADALADALADLPLAVEQAAVWRSRTGMGTAEYLELLAANRAELLAAGVAGDYPLPVAAAWHVPLVRLAREHPVALELLRLCAFFGAEPVPLRLFRGVRAAPVSPELVAALEDPVALARATREISRYGLAKIDHRDQTVRMHPLAQAVLTSRLDAGEQDRSRHVVHLLLAHNDPGDPYRVEDWPRYARLLPHVVQCRAVECLDGLVRRMLINSVRYLVEVGDFGGAAELAGQSTTAWRSAMGRADLPTLDMARLHGIGLRRLGRADEARSLNESTYAELRAQVGDDHEAVIDMLDVLAADRRRAGRLAEELRLREEVLARALRVLGPDDPETLRYANNLASSLRGTGRFAEALELDEDTARRRTEILGADHLSTLRSLTALAMDLRECGHHDDALDLLDDTLARQRGLLGDDHPHTLGTMRNLAVTRCRAGDHAGARLLAEECLTRYRRRHGELHLDTSTSMVSLSVALRHLGDLRTARELAERGHRQFARTSGPEHPFTLVAATSLAVAERLLGDLDRARERNAGAAEVLHRTLGPDHPYALVTATNLASDLAAAGEHGAAADLDADTRRRSERVLGPGHPATLAVTLNLARDLRALGEHAASARLHREVRAALGEEHPAPRSERVDCDTDTMQM